MSGPKRNATAATVAFRTVLTLRTAAGLQHSRYGASALFLARVAMDAAKAQLGAYALASDDLMPGTVEAADLLDTARAALDGAP